MGVEEAYEAGRGWRGGEEGGGNFSSYSSFAEAAKKERRKARKRKYELSKIGRGREGGRLSRKEVSEMLRTTWKRGHGSEKDCLDNK